MTMMAQACSESTVGLKTPTALYLHVSAVKLLPSFLRMLAVRARVVMFSKWTMKRSNPCVVRFTHRGQQTVSWLAFEDFDKVAHPRLLEVYGLDITDQKADRQSYRGRPNPMILHHKELMVADDYPGREKFVELTRAEGDAGLLEDVKLIGHLLQWQQLLDSHGLRIDGHRLRRAR